MIEKVSLAPYDLCDFESQEVVRVASAWLEGQKSPRTRSNYQQSIQSFVGFAQEQGIAHVQEVDGLAITRYRNHLENEKEFKPRTINFHISAVSSLFDDLVDAHIIRFNPTKGIKRKKVPRNRVEAKLLSANQARTMLEAPNVEFLKGLRDKAILGVLFFTGCRVSEVANLRVEDYFQEAEYDCLDFMIKGGARNKVAINVELKALLNHYLKASGHQGEKHLPLFLPLTKKNEPVVTDQPMTRKQISRIWKHYANLAGVPGTSPHSARTTFITTALLNNAPIEAVQKTVAHVEIKTTQCYDQRALLNRESASFKVHY